MTEQPRKITSRDLTEMMKRVDVEYAKERRERQLARAREVPRQPFCPHCTIIGAHYG